MIKDNELRINNWYSLSGMGNSQFCKFSNWTQGLDFEAYGEPLFLTPEILNKCGFSDAGESAGSHWYYKLISIPTNHMNVTYELNLFTTENPHRYGVNLEEQYFGYCESLHQLQTLYFFITREELEINLYEN